MERLLRRLGLLIVNKRPLIVIIALALIAVSAFGVTRLTIATGTETWVSTDSQIYRDYQRFGEHFGSNPIVVMVTSNTTSQLLQPDNLKAMAAIENKMGENPTVVSAIGPTFLLTLVAQQTSMPSGLDDPQAVQAIVIDPQSNQIRPEFKSVLPDDRHALITIFLKGGRSHDEEKAAVEETEMAVATAGFVGVEPVVTGLPPLTSQLQDLIASSLSTMMAVAMVLMFLILALIFGVRGFFAWRWLPIGMVGIGIIYTFGIMGLLSVPISMVSMAVFPILIGLGIDYSINLHNRYEEETSKAKTLSDAVIATVTHIGPTIGIALIAECLGFTAMLFSPVPMIRDFGVIAIIGVIICYIVAIFLTLSILYWRISRFAKGTPGNKTVSKPKKQGLGLVDRGLLRLATLVIKNPAIIISLGLALAVAGLVVDHHNKTETDMAKFISEDVPVMKSYRTLEAVASGATTTSLLVEAQDVTDPKILAWMAQLECSISTDMPDNVSSTNSIASLVLRVTGGEMPQSSEQVKQCLDVLPATLKRNLVSPDLSAANLIVSIKEFDVDRMKQVRGQLADYAADPPAGVSVAVTGETVVHSEMFEGMRGGRLRITLIGVGLVSLGVFLLFRLNLLKTLVSILPLGLVIGWVSGVIYLAGIKYNPLTACLGALILGMGVEYTILYMMRYYEERGKGEVPATAMTTAMTKVGRAIIASGVTTIGGFSALLAAGGFPIIRDFGIVTLLAVFFGLVSALVVHPPLVVLTDSWLERRRLATAQKKT